MLSGRLNMRVLQEGEWRSYYGKKDRGILLPTLVFLLIYTVRDLFPAFVSPGFFLKTLALNSLGAMSHGIFWFAFKLFGMVLVAPFLAPALTQSSGELRRAFFLLCALWTASCFISANTGIEFGWQFPIKDHFAFFCIGALIEDSRLNSLSNKQLLLLAFFAALANGVIAYFGWSSGSFDISPLYAIAALCLYLLFQRLDIKGGSAVDVVLAFLSKHSFGIYLMHWFVYEMVQPRLAFLAAVWGPLYQLCLTPLVLVLGVAAAVLVDETLVKAAQGLFDRILRRTSRFLDARYSNANTADDKDR